MEEDTQSLKVCHICAAQTHPWNSREFPKIPPMQPGKAVALQQQTPELSPAADSSRLVLKGHFQSLLLPYDHRSHTPANKTRDDVGVGVGESELDLQRWSVYQRGVSDYCAKLS
jgi:hypothetical protein